MPAPVPIQFNYGDVGLLARLATAAGQGQYRQTQEQNRLQMRSQDMSFLNGEMNRRAQYNQDRMNYSPLENMASQQQERDQAFALQNAVASRRNNTPSSRLSQSSPLAKAVEPLVPAAPRQLNPSGYVSGQEGTSTVTPQGYDYDPSEDAGWNQELINPSTGRLDMTRLPNSSRYQPGPRGIFGGGQQQQDMVTPDVKSMLDFIESNKAHIPADQIEGMKIAARSGQLKMDQMIDNIRQAQVKAAAPVGLTVKEHQLEIQRLRRGMLQFNDDNDPDHVQRSQIATLIAGEQHEMNAKLAPQFGASIATNPAPQPFPTTVTPGPVQGGMPQPGYVEEGYRFRGGNPADPNAWEPI